MYSRPHERDMFAHAIAANSQTIFLRLPVMQKELMMYVTILTDLRVCVRTGLLVSERVGDESDSENIKQSDTLECAANLMRR